uniref:Ipl1/Nuf2 chimera protein n=1 Tax=Saccharomyces cerevisiae TaxID=4932 RepID=UPI0031F5DABB
MTSRINKPWRISHSPNSKIPSPVREKLNRLSRNQDVFPILDLQELVICLQSCDFALATQENISRPTSDYMVTLYKQIIENFMGISVESLLNSSNQETGDGHLQEENENIYLDTLNVLVLNKICFKFFENIGVQDFNMTDLYKPEAQRTQRLLSAVVNYARFREERMFDCNSFILQMESLLGQINKLNDEIKQLQKDFEVEVKEIEAAYSLLSGHINKYMNEMLEYMQ